jgi:aminoglycoside 6'-N-acetyltransferase
MFIGFVACFLYTARDFDMDYICKNENVLIRKLRDCDDDYHLLAKWLSDPEVLTYYEGRSNPFDLEKVKVKFAYRARGESRVHVGIIEYNKIPIGFVQYYKIIPNEYSENELIDMQDFQMPYGMDIVIGETSCWNKGIGTEILKMLIKYLLKHHHADIIFIDPQTWNKRAIRCYEKCGFKAIGIIKERELHDGVYKDSLIMCMTALTG